MNSFFTTQTDINDNTGEGDGWYNKGTEDFLMAGGADVALCSSCIYAFSNMKIVNTLFVYEIIGTTIMVPKPKPVDSSTFLYIAVSEFVWIFYIASLVIICVILNLVAIEYVKYISYSVLAKN